MKKIAQGFFKSHPSVNEFFFTADEQAFFTKQQAKNHAQSLPKEMQEVTPVTRAEAEGDDDKAAAQKEAAVTKAKTAVANAETKLEDVKAKFDAEANDAKKQNLELAVGTATKAVEDAKAKLAELEA